MEVGIGIAVTVLALAIAARRIFWLGRLVRSGRSAPDRLKGVFGHVRAEATDVIAQRKLFKRTVPGVAHAITFWGFIILLFTIIEAYGNLFSNNFAIPVIGHTAVLGFLEDFFAVIILIAILVFSVIRLREAPAKKERASRFYGSHTKAAWFVLLMIALVLITLLGYRGAQVNAGGFSYGWWAFASHLVARALVGLGHSANRTIEVVLLELNIAAIMGFLIFVVYSKHLHIFAAPLNVAFSRRPRALGPLATTPNIDLEEVSEDTVFGAGTIEQLSWKQLLDLVTCTECGRCQAVCPAWNTGKPLSPKLLIMSLRDNLFASSSRLLTGGGGSDASGESSASALVPDVISPDILWSCTTCGACVEECPVDIEHIDAIVDMRRYEVLMESRFPTEAGTMLRNIENRGDPWGLGASGRGEWMKGLDFEIPVVKDKLGEEIEYLYWVGCAGALDERARKATQATVRLLYSAGVRFAILAERESCTGDPARRLGNEYLFQTQTRKNIEVLDEAEIKKIIVSCPHCFNTIAREYPALGGNYEVIHHSQLLADLVANGRITMDHNFDVSVTYHDPCYLARHNRVINKPRSLLENIPGIKIIEMDRCKERGFCCGAGGSRMWMEENIGKRINLERTDEALATGADVIATACPYCLIMIDDGIKERQQADEVRVLDISQIAQETLSPS
ncbi:MAG: heterodisulfide reductase-related iron-sulfur binding cluster [Actinobacteria bacterium]|nr:heterodisulfide reductase-related iron-sulfur binding cluster [Actinomycetota bacterium]MCL6104258.1 heterodisulfide reductase-related iron-sulfur binding cluster [Actinomycetota bacterium]